MLWTNPADLVRSGYNALSRHYRGDDDAPHEYDRWLADLRLRLPDRGQILDIGCGCGVPVARHLTAAGNQVTGVDISDVQIERARRLVPGATFIRADATEMNFRSGSFDAVICLYALIHMPLDRQPRLLDDIARWLRPGGWLLATTGQDAWTGTEDNWLGGPATMWWSHAGAATYRTWIYQAAWRSPTSSSFLRVTAATRCSGLANPRPTHPGNLIHARRRTRGPPLVNWAMWARSTETILADTAPDLAPNLAVTRAGLSHGTARPGQPVTTGDIY